MRALRFFCLSKLNHSVGNGDNSSLFLLILIFLRCCSDFQTVESAHSARLIRFSKRQAPPEGCAVAVKLYGAVTDTVLKLGVAAPECESCCYGVTASTHSAIVTAGGAGRASARNQSHDEDENQHSHRHPLAAGAGPASFGIV